MEMLVEKNYLELSYSNAKKQTRVRYLDGIYGHGNNTVGQFMETDVTVADFSGEGVFHLFGGSRCACFTKLILLCIRATPL